MNINDLEKLAKEATPGPWTILAHSAIVSETNGEYIVTKAPGFKLPLEAPKNFEYMAAFNPATTLKLIAVVKAAQETEKKFMAIDDGFYTGLVPPEFAEVSAALRELDSGEAR